MREIVDEMGASVPSFRPDVEAVVRAAPDGYTLGTLSPNSMVTRRVLAKGGSPIDVLKDMTPVTAMGDAVMLVLPADHVVEPAAAFAAAVNAARASKQAA